MDGGTVTICPTCPCDDLCVEGDPFETIAVGFTTPSGCSGTGTDNDVRMDINITYSPPPACIPIEFQFELSQFGSAFGNTKTIASGGMSPQDFFDIYKQTDGDFVDCDPVTVRVRIRCDCGWHPWHNHDATPEGCCI